MRIKIPTQKSYLVTFVTDTLMSTSMSFRVVFSTSLSLRTSGGPYFVHSITFHSVFLLICQVFLFCSHSDDDISLFMPFIYISMRFNNLFQRICSIYDRLDLACLNKLCKEG